MKTTAIKYQDRHKNEVISFTSGIHFFTLFLQKERLSESSEFRSAHDISPYNKPFTFTGKERDSETGFSYFGARYYDSDLSGLFISVDPMSDKYPSISPYAYCAWNPVKLVDPDGRKIWIVGDDGNEYQYVEGKLYTQEGDLYEGVDEFARRIASCLDDISSSAEGFMVIAKLEGSQTKYTYKNESPSNPNANGGFSDISQDLKVKGLDFGSISHESFHAYQYDYGMKGASDVREVGAYLFQAIMIDANRSKEQWSDCGMAISLFCGDGQYTNAMYDLFTNGFSLENYTIAVNNFFNESYYGRKYSKLPNYKHAEIPDAPPIKDILLKRLKN